MVCYKCGEDGPFRIVLDPNFPNCDYNLLPCCSKHFDEYRNNSNNPVSIIRSFEFESAHKLLNYIGKCQNTHGHSYKLTVEINRKIDKDTDMVMDFGDLKRIVNNSIIEQLDHKMLNDVFEFNPTAENMCVWIWKELHFAGLYGLREVRLWETSGAYAKLTLADMCRLEG